MRWFFMSVWLIGGMSACVPGLVTRAVPNGDAEQTLRALQQEWAEAEMRRDTATMARILADEFVVIDPGGRVAGKQQVIQGAMSPDLVLESVTLSDIDVRVYSGTAVVTSRATIRARYREQDASGQSRYTRVYVRQDKRWRMVATHVSDITQA